MKDSWEFARIFRKIVTWDEFKHYSKVLSYDHLIIGIDYWHHCAGYDWFGWTRQLTKLSVYYFIIINSFSSVQTKVFEQCFNL